VRVGESYVAQELFESENDVEGVRRQPKVGVALHACCAVLAMHLPAGCARCRQTYAKKERPLSAPAATRTLEASQDSQARYSDARDESPGRRRLEGGKFRHRSYPAAPEKAAAKWLIAPPRCSCWS
jgi:hypothetical protein